MRDLTFTPMTKSGAGGPTTVKVDTREFNRLMKKTEKDIAEAMYKATGDAFAYALSQTESYLRGYTSIEPLAKRVADSLGYDKRQDRKRKVKKTDKEVSLEGAMFGSRGPNPRGQLGGEGVHTEPDDTGGTYQIAVALQEGIAAGPFRFTGARGSNGNKGGAKVHGRQVGTSGGPTSWYGHGGQGYSYGFTRLDYLAVAERAFRGRIDSAMSRQMKRRME